MGEYCNPWKVFGYVSLLYFFYNLFGFVVSGLLVASLIHFTHGLKDLKYAKKIIIRDLSCLWLLGAKVIPNTIQSGDKSYFQMFLETAKKYPTKKALIEAETGRYLTFKEVEVFINKIGHVFKKAGFEPGNKVALFMGNELEYVPIWLGLNRIGITVGLINCNLHGKSLEHSLTVVEFKGIICTSNLKPILDDIGFGQKPGIPIYTLDGKNKDSTTKNLPSLMEKEDGDESLKEEKMGLKDTSLFIYTSGSTGRPKAAKVVNGKIKEGLVKASAILNINPDDVCYNCLPMYHSSGGLILIAPLLYLGCTMVIRKKFSASSFFTDCIKYDVTYLGYIGEIWKYLLSQPPKDTDRKHKVKTVIGNGLRSNLVSLVNERFGIYKILEFYGATEGNAGLVNFDNTPGAVGFLFRLFPFLNPGFLVKADVETGELIRDGNGRAIRCKPNEVGTFVISINKRAQYHGYANNEKESNKKIARNVFSEGDAAFLSGDLLVMDEYHYVYFVDRIGDTFRWKSENVSTTEVENIMSSVVKSAEDVVVYPVPIPGESGNAGMAYIREKPDEKFSTEDLAKALLVELPKYAIPMFIRVGSNLDQTGTFKYQKSALKKQNYDLESYDVKDSVYVYDVIKKDYVMLDSEILDKIKNQEMKI